MIFIPFSKFNQARISRANHQTIPIRGSQLVVLRSYTHQYFDEMDLKEGETIAFMDQLEDGWWRGMKLGNPAPVCYSILIVVSYIRIILNIIVSSTVEK